MLGLRNHNEGETHLNTGNDTKSPLKASPLRNPGQSLDEKINKLVDDEISMWIVFIVVTIMLAGLEWWRWYTDPPFSPLSYSLVAIIVTIVGTRKLSRFRQELRRLRLGRDGEKAVGQYLDLMREQGYKVFHDVIGDEFNIDHVLIGRKGVFSVETKTFSKPVGKNPSVKFDGSTLSVNNFKPDRDPVVQAKAQAHWLTDLLRESTGKTFQVKPVLVFPGWYVESKNMKDVWVLNPKALEAFLSNETDKLSQDDVSLIAFHLSRFIRASL
ncbi:MAG: NERD domain-containing protein [Gammaproteobacteria bacterium]|nr:MAG: NERD domain-containing protein [Gammaproteobacteria bacterium]